MTQPEPNHPSSLPHARKERNRLTYLFWLAPIAAAGFAVWLLYENVLARGPSIVIRFKDATGIQAGKTEVMRLGAKIGEVKSLKLTPDDRAVEVEVELLKPAARLARAGTLFWLVKPEIGPGGIHGLATVISGDHIEARPGAGPVHRTFTALQEAPADEHARPGLVVAVLAKRRGSLRRASPVYYRDMRVGEVLECALTPEAQAVKCSLKIERRYATLVRANSRFWNASGVQIDAGLFGLDLRLNPLKAVFAGGVAFATPDPPGPPAESGAIFALEEKAEDDWLKWAPAIPLPPATPETEKTHE